MKFFDSLICLDYSTDSIVGVVCALGHCFVTNGALVLLEWHLLGVARRMEAVVIRALNMGFLDNVFFAEEALNSLNCWLYLLLFIDQSQLGL